MSSKSSELEPDPDYSVRLGYEQREQGHEYGQLEQEYEENRTPM